ncbi:phosphoesterase, partial [Thermodesulfobacteriota bacterium]
AGQALIEDVRAFQFLFRHANIHLARKIEQADLKFNFLKFFKIAFEGMKRRRGRLFAHLGSVPNPDVCVVIADFFMRVDAVNWSIVSGLYNKKLIVVFRNDGLREDAGKLAKHRFDQLGSAGGHKSMARAEIPFANLKAHVDPRDGDKLLMWIVGQIEKREKKI